jgi:hypothetical protein
VPDAVKITKDGKLYEKRWDEEKQKHRWNRVKKFNVGTSLRCACTLQKGVTLRSIFDVVESYDILKLFIGQYSWCRHLEKFHEAMKKPKNSDKRPLNHLEVYWHAEVESVVSKTKAPGGHKITTKLLDYELSAGFHGFGVPTQDEIDNHHIVPDPSDGMICYSVSCTPMSELADVEVRLNEVAEIYEPWTLGYHSKDNPPSREKIKDVTRQFTLLEVLDAIYWDISFYGGPEESEEFLEGLKQTKEEIEAGLVAMIPHEQVMKQLGVTGEEVEPPKEGELKILVHPKVVKFFGVDPNAIPLDDKEFVKPKEET